MGNKVYVFYLYRSDACGGGVSIEVYARREDALAALKEAFCRAFEIPCSDWDDIRFYMELECGTDDGDTIEPDFIEINSDGDVSRWVVEEQNVRQKEEKR